MCIVSNWVNEAQDLIAVTKYDDLPNSLIPSIQLPAIKGALKCQILHSNIIYIRPLLYSGHPGAYGQ